MKDSGIRCIAPPCPSYAATLPDQPGRDALLVHELDLSALPVSDQEREQLMQAIMAGPGLRVKATVDTIPHAGPAGAATVLRVTQVVRDDK